MTNDLIVIFLGIVVAIAFGTIVAYTLRKWLVVHPLSSNVGELSQENRKSQYPDLNEKLRLHLGIGIPTHAIETLLSIPNNDDVIVMLKYKQAFQNILRCHSDGSLVWKAELPRTSGDFYTHVSWNEQKLKASSWSCFNVTLDIDTGKILSSEFTK